MSLNKVCIMGRLTSSPEVRHTQSGIAVANFTIAVDRDFKSKTGNERATDFFDVVAWAHTAEFVSKYLSKGRMAVVEGQLRTQKWTDKEGKPRKRVEIWADNVYFGDSKCTTATGYDGDTSNTSRAFNAPPDVGQVNLTELTEDDGELPF